MQDDLRQRTDDRKYYLSGSYRSRKRTASETAQAFSQPIEKWEFVLLPFFGG